MTRVLVIDNYDSFVYTLNGYLQQLGAETVVMRNDDHADVDMAGVISEYDAVLVSPGPGKPSEAGVSIPTVTAALASGTPAARHLPRAPGDRGGVRRDVTNAEELMHGKTSLVTHDDGEFYLGVPKPFTATRYHSLAVVDGTVPSDLVVTSRTEGGVIMGLRHEAAPIVGVQFHPESVLTEGGYRMLGNWLEGAGLVGARDTASRLSPLVRVA